MTEKLTLRCHICRCLIDQAKADRGAEAAGPGHDTCCEDCGQSLSEIETDPGDEDREGGASSD